MTNVTFRSVKFSEELDEEQPECVRSSGGDSTSRWTTFCPPLFPDWTFDHQGLPLARAIFTMCLVSVPELRGCRHVSFLPNDLPSAPMASDVAGLIFNYPAGFPIMFITFPLTPAGW